MKAQRWFLAIILVLALLASLSGLTQIALARSNAQEEVVTPTGSITVHKFNAADNSDIGGWLFRLYSLDKGLQQVGEGT
ncbi:MAG: hypothetical protein OEW09_10700, partial [Anaerolineae bacterium]|nr:hypothetical protein [Anaerolineae bacterium]